MTAARHAWIGVLGGTFDPVHVGHLVMAQEVHVRCRLDQVLFVPTGRPPHKRHRAVTARAHRLAMLELALAGNPAFAISRVEIERAGPSYSIETLEALRRDLGPATRLFFILGSDQLADLPTWHRPRELLALCQIVAVERPGTPRDLGKLEEALPEVAQRVVWVLVPQLAISASDLRGRVAAGRPIRYLVPEAVREYIAAHHLYERGRARAVE